MACTDGSCPHNPKILCQYSPPQSTAYIDQGWGSWRHDTSRRHHDRLWQAHGEYETCCLSCLQKRLDADVAPQLLWQVATQAGALESYWKIVYAGGHCQRWHKMLQVQVRRHPDATGSRGCGPTRHTCVAPPSQRHSRSRPGRPGARTYHA